jgi:PPK2 family polyphosphate:nucleotide phosphotransferase
MPKITKINRENIRKFIKRYLVTNGKEFRLKDADPDDTGGLRSEDKDEAREILNESVRLLSEQQEKLYAQDRWGLLLIFQAMDAAGKDSSIKHVMSGINPQGCQIFSFKAPSNEDLDHDYLWRTMRCLPERGRIGIFNRSYYEEVLVVRVHPEILAKQKLPGSLVGKKIWKNRYKDIRSFEGYLHRNGYAIRKFFLHVSKKEQKKRFLERLDRPEKNWKFSSADAKERDHWQEYQEAYEDMSRHTATGYAPWCVAPADNKWFTRLVVAAVIADALLDLNLAFPEVTDAQKKELAAAKRMLLNE